MTVEVRHRATSPARARALAAAVGADTPKFVTLTTDGAELVVRVAPASAGSVRATLEDLLACLRAAEKSGDASPTE